MRTLAPPAVLVASLSSCLLLGSGCEKTCDSLADCRLDEVCSYDGHCIAEPERPVIPVGEGEGEGEGEGQAGEGEGEGEGVIPPVGGGGLCASRSDIFDTDEVFLWGTLSEGACYLDAIAGINSPDSYAVGIGCNALGRSQVRNDGRLVFDLYGEDGAPARLHVFTKDSHPYDEDLDFDDEPDVGDCDYPDDPHANDPELATPGCAAEVDVHRWALQTSSSSVAYTCNGASEQIFVDDEAFPQTFMQDVLGFSADGYVLLQSNDIKVLDVSSGTFTSVTGLVGSRVTARARDEGFFIVTDQGDGVATLFDVDGASAVATSVGNYAYDVDNMYLYRAVLDSSGRLLLEGHDPDGDVFADCIYQLAIGQPTEKPYTEIDEPLVKIHISHLFSGGSATGF